VTHARNVKRIRPLAVAALAVGAGLTAVWPAGAGAAAPVGAYTTKGAWSFVSAPGLHPPKLSTTAPTVHKQLAPGNFLIANFPNVAASGPMTGEGGPLIVNNQLQPVWFRPVGTGVVSADLQQETYQGKPVLVWWQGLLTKAGAVSQGQLFIVNQHYRQIATLKAQRPWIISLHDAVISGSDIWVTVYRDVPNQNLVAYGGSRRDTVYDAGVQEYDLQTSKLVYTWDALNPGGPANVPLSASEQPASARSAPGGAWDAYHLNSVQVLPGNQILVSMRNTWAAYLVNTDTNKIVWALGGKPSADSFTIAPNARFAWEHDVQLLPNDEVSLFDDNCCKLLAGGKFASPNGPSRGMVLRLNMSSHTASLVAAYPHTPTRNVAFLGSMQVLPNGNALVGWGSLPYFSEFTKSGKLLLDAAFPGKDQSYRALFSNTWVGTPHYPPTGAVRKARGTAKVYASWNGATQVAAWELLAGPSAAHLTNLATQRSGGFQTTFTLSKASYKVFKVRALDAKRHALGTSRSFS
jgi:hypothetical protein